MRILLNLFLLGLCIVAAVFVFNIVFSIVIVAISFVITGIVAVFNYITGGNNNG